MRNTVVRLGDPDMRIGAIGRFVPDHEREHAADVALQRQVQTAVGYRQMVVERFGQSDRRIRNAGERAETLLHTFELQLDVTDVVQVLVEDYAVRRAERALEPLG